MKVGDRVIGADGKACRVTGVFPQGEKEIFRVTFTDGSSTECCDEHLWQVNSALRKWQGLTPRVFPLSKIRQRLQDGHGNNLHFIPIAKAIEFDTPVEQLPLDPYMLGALLGDGGLSRKSVMFSSADEEVVESIRAELPPDHEIKHASAYDYRIVGPAAKKRAGVKHGSNKIKNALVELGLLGKRTERKFVPDRYKLGSVETRLAILQGLLDTDGYVMPGTCTIEICSVSWQLANDIQFLVESLGGTSRLTEKPTKCQLAYRIRVSLPAPLEPFRLSRRKMAHVQRTKYQPSRSIVSVEWIGKKQAQCIAVDAPDHLYVTDRFIVTHNTPQLLGLINAQHIRRALIVVPASLRLNWLREASRWLAKPTRIHLLAEPKIIQNLGPTPHWVTAGPVLPDDVCKGDVIVIANYDRVRDATVLAQLLACRWDLLAADEAHYLKNPKSQRTVAVLGKEVKGVLTKGLRHASDKIVVMTGTPLPNKPVEMWPILHAVAPKTFPAFFPYVRRYCDAKQVFISPRVGSKWDFNGASNLGELQELLRSTCMVRRLKADVLHDLPPKIRQIITLPTEGFEDLIAEQEEDEDTENFVQTLAGALDTLGKVVSMEEAYANAAALLGKAGKLNFKTVARQREKLALRKLPDVLEICDNRLEEEKKIIIFAHHHSVVEKVLAHYNKKGKAPVAVAVYGPVDARKRDDAVTAFQNDDSIRVFVGSIAAAGVGLTLTAASTVVFAEVDWVPANMVQAEDRAHRIGQVDVVNVLHVVVERSLDARMIQLLVAKADIADRALDKPAAMVVPEAGVDWGAEKRERAVAEAKKWPPVSPLLRELVQEAMQHLTGLDSDRAQKQNDEGFSRFDGDIGRKLAHAADPTPGMVWGIGVKFAQKYRRQLGNLSDRIADEAKLLQGSTPVPLPVRETRAQREAREMREFDAAWALTKSHVSHADPERHSRYGVMPIRPGYDLLHSTLAEEISRVKREIFDAETEMEREDRSRQRGRDRDEW